MQTPPPSNMQPGNQSVSGSGLTENAFGEPHNGEARFAPDSVNFKPQGPAEAMYYHPGDPPPAGGGVRQKAQTKSMPLERGK